MDGPSTTISLEAEPEGLLAARLIELAAAAPSGILLVARSETRAERLQRVASALEPGMPVLLLPSWDCLPYDRVGPSRRSMGTRMDTAHRLAEYRDGPLLVIAGVEAATQRLPPPGSWRCIELRAGEAIDHDAVTAALRQLGYTLEDVVDQPGEAANRGAVLDIYPAAAALPYRVEHEEGRITEIRSYDPATQRSLAAVPALTIGPASELPPTEDGEGWHPPGSEHALPDLVPGLVSTFDLLPHAMLVLDPEVEVLQAERFTDIQDAFASLTAETGSQRPASPPEALYLDAAAWSALRRDRRVLLIADASDEPATRPALSSQLLPTLLREHLKRSGRVGLAGPSGPRRTLLRTLARRPGLQPEPVAGWLALRDTPPGTIGLLPGPLDEGFADADTLVIAPADVLGPSAVGNSGAAAAPFAATLAPGDAVIHIDHGMAKLRGVETIEANDCLRLAYAAEMGLLVRVEDIHLVWRYGADMGAVMLDRLNTEAWPKRRAAVEQDIAATATRLVALARERDAARAPAMRPDRRNYDRFAARFTFALTADQAETIRLLERDLASGRPMDRLVCGDVGYGKTEIALRAAAIAAICGHQVAVVAPTTVLVRQHLETFRRRFAGLGVEVAALSRLTPGAKARDVRKGLADGSVRVVIGTQAVAAKTVQFKNLGLLVIDEEQRFGVKQKDALRALRAGVHVLTLTATPIPRTLQAALTGLQQLSILSTPPARRQPVRTVLEAFDPVVVMQALQREARRGGQSFFVCPRIEDLPEMRARIAGLVPQLSLIEVHGGMKPEAMDEAMVRFAGGDGDVLLSTNIIEAGLDVPRANTMLVWRPDRFGLAQLHQLRGRVGRGRVRGAVYLLTEPDVPLEPSTQRRLEALVEHDRLGAGFAISARDLDLRGAGDLLGEDQAGHMKLLGLDLYRHMLRRALRLARGEAAEEDWTPEITIDLPAFLPHDYVEDAGLRVELHRRLAEAVRAGDQAIIDRLEEEIEDRFGPLPDPVRILLDVAHLRTGCRRAGISRLDAGPDAVAATLRGEARPDIPEPLERRGARLVLPRPSTAGERIAVAGQLLEMLEN